MPDAAWWLAISALVLIALFMLVWGDDDWGR